MLKYGIPWQNLIIWQFCSAKSRFFYPYSEHTLGGHLRFCSRDRFPPNWFSFCLPLRGLSVCKQLMLRQRFQFLHENHFSVSEYSGTVLNRGRSRTNKGSMAPFFFIPCVWPRLHWLFCCGVQAREQEFVACWRVVQWLFLCFGWNCLRSHHFSPFHHLSPFLVRGWTRSWWF